MSNHTPGGDPRGLGRGPLTRWLPVYWQAGEQAPTQAPFAVDAAMTPAQFTRRVALAAKAMTVPAAGFAVAHEVGEALVPVVMGLAIDRALATGRPEQLLLWLVVLGATFLMLSVTYRYAAQLTERASQGVQHRLRATLTARLLHPAGENARQSDGTVLSTATNDVERLSSAVRLGVFPVGQLGGIAFAAVLLLLIHWQLGLAVIVGTPFVVWLMAAVSGPFTRRTRQYQSLLAAAVGQATDLVAGYWVIKGLGAEAEATRRYERSSRDALAGAQHSTDSLGFYTAGTTVISGVFVAAIAGLAGLFAVRGEITVGELIAVTGLSQALLAPLTALTANAGAVWASSVASGGRVLDLLRRSEPPATLPRSEIERQVAGLPVIEFALADHDVVQVAPGELIGVRAEDRDAADLVATLLNPSSTAHFGARILLDGRPAEHLDLLAYRSRVVVAPHSATLFTGTMADNLDVPAAPAHLRGAALSAAGCDDFVAASTAGLDTPVGENGGRLSGGQRQRLALARALVTDAPVLVLHDPTTAVDSVTETAIATGIRQLREERATVLITSSPALLSACHRIVDLRAEQAVS